jgi:hypothetical protein
MRKNYFYSIILLALFALTASAQDNSKQQPKPQEATDALGFYPNPVSNGKIYITSKTTGAKEVTVFDVLGKKVLQTTLSARELNISSISPGVYIIKIKEGDASATRKLIIK